jgi:Zn-finger nucleic acid-binding protein
VDSPEAADLRQELDALRKEKITLSNEKALLETRMRALEATLEGARSSGPPIVTAVVEARNEAAQLRKDVETLRSQHKIPPAIPANAQSHIGRCATCGKVLRQEQYESLVIDRCPGCGAMFLAAAQVEKLNARLNDKASEPVVERRKSGGWFKGLFGSPQDDPEKK